MLCLVLILIVLLVVRQWKMQRFLKLSKQIKCSIKSYPLIGHAHMFIGSGTDRVKTIQRFGREAIKNGGMTGMWLGGQYYVVVTDAVDLEVIMKTSLEKDDVMRFTRYFIGNGSIYAPVSIWRPRRKIITSSFSPKNLSNYVQIFAHQSGIMVNQLKSVARNGVVPIWKYLITYTFDSICETSFGVNLNSQENPDEPLLKAISESIKYVSERMTQPWLHPDAVYRLLPCHTKFENVKGIGYGILTKLINSKQKELKENVRSNKYGVRSFLQLLIEVSGGERGYTDLELREEMLVLLLAATDTSAVGLSFTVSMMAYYPDVQEKVFQELQVLYGDSHRPVTSEDLPRLKYLDAVIKETLRLYPPVPVINRKIKEDTKLPSGITLIKDCSVLVNIISTHRNPVYWGDDAEKFRPERFIEGQLHHPAAFIAFSNGPRNCIGYRYAMMSMKTGLATLLRKYQFLIAEEERVNNINNNQHFNLTSDLMMRDANECRVIIVERT